MGGWGAVYVMKGFYDCCPLIYRSHAGINLLNKVFWSFQRNMFPIV